MSTTHWAKSLTAQQVESGNRIDHLMTLEIRPFEGGLPAGIVAPMYDVCRRHHGAPLSMLAASALQDRVEPGSTVFIATGAGVAPALPQGETDGPVGAAALALALIKGLGAQIIFVTEEAHLPPVAAVAHLVNATLWPAAQSGGDRMQVRVEAFPVGQTAGQARAQALLAQYRPSAVIFIERDGPNEEAQFHGVRGDCRDAHAVGHVCALARHAAQAHVLTIGIGDGGNEVGFGAVRHAIRAVLPLHGRSLAGHASGIVTTAATDVTVSAAVSNWGACAVAAALAVLRADAGLLYDADSEHAFIAATVAAGARDGATGRPGLSVDGIGLAQHRAFITLLHGVVAIAIGDSETRKAR